MIINDLKLLDGAPCHCTTTPCLQFLNDKFENRVTSRRSEFIWPAHSPDLNPLDYWFWGQVEREVSSGSPESIESLKEVVERSARLMDVSLIRRAVGNINKRVELCAKKKGGHFESELKFYFDDE